MTRAITATASQVMGKLLRQRLPASSLIEVTVAMVLIVMTFAFALMIYLNITATGGNLVRLQYANRLQQMAVADARNNDYLGITLEEDNATIIKEVVPYKNTAQLLLVRYTALQGTDRVLATYEHLVYVPEQ